MYRAIRLPHLDAVMWSAWKVEIANVTADDLCWLSAVAMGVALRTRQLSPVELVRAHLERIERVNPLLEAYVTVTAERALDEARHAEQAIAAGEIRSALHGVPFALKDIFATRGVRTTAGSAILADWIPEADATTVTLLDRAGAILLGKVNTHEFAYGVTSRNSIATTRNPWDPQRIPGGSSGGSGAAVAAGLAPFSLGSDTAGSIRIPAAFCGIVGLKPTYGRVSCHGVISQSWTADHVGPLTRSVEDAAAVLQIIAGQDPRDYSTARTPVPDFSAELGRGVTGLRIGVPIELLELPVQDEVRLAFDGACRLFERLGAWIREVSIPTMRDAIRINAAIIQSETTVMHEERQDDVSAAYGDDVRQLLEEGMSITVSDYVRASDGRQRLRFETEDVLMNEVDLLLTPGTPIVAPEIGTERVDLGGRSRPLGTTSIQYLAPFSLIGIPALSLPAGQGQAGLPVGIQLIGRAFDEVTVLRAGHAFEHERGPFGRPPLLETDEDQRTGNRAQ